MFEVAARINNVQYSPAKPVATPVQSGSTASSSAQTSSRPLNGGISTFSASREMTLSLISVVTAVVVGPCLFL